MDMNKLTFNKHYFKGIGEIFIVAFEDQIVFITMSESKLINFSINMKKDLTYDSKVCIKTIKQLTEYFEGERKEFKIKTQIISGTELQRQIWEEIRKIPYGKVVTYKDLAEKIGNPNSTRAVGTAVSSNPIPFVIPCHRVINSNGKVGGYMFGQEIKENLLKLEGYKL